MRKPLPFWIFLSLALAVALPIAHPLFSVASQNQAPPSATQPTSLPPIIAPSTQTPQPTTPQLTVVVDPAHGGTDNGARGGNGINEKDVVLAFARGIRAELTKQGFRVVLTRDSDANPTFDDRAAVANQLGDAIFISLHVASTGTPGTVRVYSFRVPTPLPSATAATSPLSLTAPSAEGLVPWRDAQISFADRSRRFADLVQSSLAQKYSGSPSAAATSPIRELRSVAQPAIAIEVSNISSPNVSTLESMSPSMAAALAQSISSFHQSSSPASAAAGAAH